MRNIIIGLSFMFASITLVDYIKDVVKLWEHTTTWLIMIVMLGVCYFGGYVIRDTGFVRWLSK